MALYTGQTCCNASLHNASQIQLWLTVLLSMVAYLSDQYVTLQYINYAPPLFLISALVFQNLIPRIRIYCFVMLCLLGHLSWFHLTNAVWGFSVLFYCWVGIVSPMPQLPTCRTRVPLFVWQVVSNMSSMDGPTSSLAADGILILILILIFYLRSINPIVSTISRI